MIRNFLFHRVNPQRDKLWDPMDVALFDRCISFITSNYQVMLLEDMVSVPDLSSSDNIATILFDDGYKDNIEYAAPILAKYNCKASFYVVTDCIEKNIPTWTHILEHKFQYTAISDINLMFDFLPLDLQVTQLPTHERRIEYVKSLIPYVKKLPHQEREIILDRIFRDFNDVDLPRIMMDWQDLAELKRAGHYIGSHTVSHCMLGTMSDEQEILDELIRSGRMIEKHLGYYPSTISYPVGSYNETTVRLSKEAGYTVGLAVGQRLFDPATDSVFAIPRIELYNESWFKTKLRILNYLEPLKTFLRHNQNTESVYIPAPAFAAGRLKNKETRGSQALPQQAMNKPTSFSIVVPTYNRAHLLPKTIESILAQTYPHYELIIVDDGSKDNTEEVVRKYLSDKVHYYKKTNGERAAARNYGTSLATGDYVNWFDSDDIMFPDHLQEAADFIARLNNPEIIAQGHRHQHISGRVIEVFSYPANINKELYKGNPIANSPVIVRRDIALANPFNEDRGLSGSEDYELWLRMGARYAIHPSDKVTLAVIDHDERSMITMSDPDQLVTRFTRFIRYTTSDPGVNVLLGRHKSIFVMKNYLLLSVILVNNNHFELASRYFRMALSTSAMAVFERGFYAYIKNYLRQSFVARGRSAAIATAANS